MADNYTVRRASYASVIATLYVEYLRMHYSKEEAMRLAIEDAVQIRRQAVSLEAAGGIRV